MSSPRYITAAEVLEERAALREQLGHVPHGTGRGWSSMLWIYCDCPNCRDSYDPTGEESAKYLNMEYPSFFNGQHDVPSFAFSKIAAESFLAHLKPGFYIGNAKKAAALDDVVMILTPPLVLRPARILRVGEDYTWDEFILSEDKTKWSRRTYKNGHSIFYREGEDQNIPLKELGPRLTELFS